jgi:hypothetical protein
MSNRAQKILREIEDSKSAQTVAQVLRKRRSVAADDLPPEEADALRMLVTWPGTVERSSFGNQLEQAENVAIGVNGGDGLVKCPACDGGWVRKTVAEMAAYSAEFLRECESWAEQEFERVRRNCEQEGLPFDDEVERLKSERVGRRRAFELDRENPRIGSQTCGLCRGSCMVIDHRVPPDRADPECMECGGTGKVPYVALSIDVAPDGNLRTVNRTLHRQCRCCDQTVEENANNQPCYTGDGPEPQRLAMIGHLLRRMRLVESLTEAPTNVIAALRNWRIRPGMAFSSVLSVWYGPEGDSRYERLWPFVTSGAKAIEGQIRDPSKWRAVAKDRKGGEQLVKSADKEAMAVLKAARRAWLSTTEKRRSAAE